MTQQLQPTEHIKVVGKFVRDLLTYDRDLIKFDRTMTQQDDVSTSYIVVNGAQASTAQSTGKTFDGVAELMNYNTTMSQAIIIEFYGDAAYTNSNDFLLLSKSQKATDLKRSLGLTTYNVKQSTDVKQILGSQYGNRVHVEFNITYTPNIDVETLRIDTAQFEFITED
jgi:hypothetical protein